MILKNLLGTAFDGEPAGKNIRFRGFDDGQALPCSGSQKASRDYSTGGSAIDGKSQLGCNSQTMAGEISSTALCTFGIRSKHSDNALAVLFESVA